MPSISTRRTDIFSILNPHKDLPVLIRINKEDPPEADIIQQLTSLLEKDPDSLFDRDEEGNTPLHRAKTPAIYKLFVEADTSLLNLRATNNHGDTPAHLAIPHGDLEKAKYLFKVHPESINIPDNSGHYPIHTFLFMRSSHPVEEEEVFQFMLEHNQGAVATHHGRNLPLHLAMKGEDGDAVCLSNVKCLFDAYPSAVHIRNRRGLTPVEMARELARQYADYDTEDYYEAISYLEHQLDFIQQLSLHEALRNVDVSLGALKLMIEANPQSLRSEDSQGQLPVHTACGMRDISVVKCLVEAYPDSLKSFGANNNLPLHIACREGKFDVINFILERSDYGVGLLGGDEMLPIHLLLLRADVDRDSVEYVDSVGRLLRLNPTSLMSNLML